jgi:hypothetical protein
MPKGTERNAMSERRGPSVSMSTEAKPNATPGGSTTLRPTPAANAVTPLAPASMPSTATSSGATTTTAATTTTSNSTSSAGSAAASSPREGNKAIAVLEAQLKGANDEVARLRLALADEQQKRSARDLEHDNTQMLYAAEKEKTERLLDALRRAGAATAPARSIDDERRIAQLQSQVYVDPCTRWCTR